MNSILLIYLNVCVEYIQTCRSHQTSSTRYHATHHTSNYMYLVVLVDQITPQTRKSREIHPPC